MQGFNVIWVFNPSKDKVLMCYRHKNPYKGLYNLVGGKIDKGEDGLAAAYRELQEETGIVDIKLKHLMNFTYFIEGGCYLEAYFGKLDSETEVFGDEKELVWIDINENLFDSSRFAGEGSIGHIFEVIKNIDTHPSTTY